MGHKKLKKKEEPRKEISDEKLQEVWKEAIINGADEILSLQLSNQEEKKVASLVFNLKRLKESRPEEYDALVNNTIDSLDLITSILRGEKNGKFSFKEVLFVFENSSPECMLSKKKIRELRAEDIGKLVIFDGLVRNSTGVVPEMKLVALWCTECGTMTYVRQEGDMESTSTTKCSSCGAFRESLFRREDKSLFLNFLKCEVEEDPEGHRGKQPERIPCEIEGTLTDEENRIGVGDRVTIIGVYKVREKSKASLVYQGYIEVLGVSKRGKNYEEFVVSTEDEEKLLEMSKDPDLLKKFTAAVAPNIAGHTVEKAAMVLQMFGGNLFAGDRRGDIHILLIGDPGVGKSKVVRNVIEVAPLVVKASGAPTTTVGLTACVVKDETMPGGFILEAGAAVLADGGVIVIDEFDKMSKEARGAMHEIMEDQKTTISKANINTELNTRCSVLAIMNPKRNRFNNLEPMSDQIDLPQTMLSRFDLIFAIRDKIDEKEDRERSEAVFRAREGTEVITEYSKEDITKYIIYARSKIHNISVSAAAKDFLTDKYIAIRNSNKDDDTIPITLRQLDGMIRLSEACAKARLSPVVEKKDAEVAMGIVEYYLRTMCMDPSTNKFNIDVGQGGESKRQRIARISLPEFIKENLEILSEGNKNGWIIKEELEDSFMKAMDVTEREFEKALGEAKDGGLVLYHDNDYWIEYKGKKKEKEELHDEY